MKTPFIFINFIFFLFFFFFIYFFNGEIKQLKKRKQPNSCTKVELIDEVSGRTKIRHYSA